MEFTSADEALNRLQETLPAERETSALRRGRSRKNR
jgi:hypothetical protein